MVLDGTPIKNLRKEHGLTQQQLADSTGLSIHAINSYENGRREPNAKAMAALERFFGVSGAYLRGETDQRQPAYAWEDAENMPVISAGFPSQFAHLAELVAKRTNLEQQVVFSIMVELRHVLNSKKQTDVQKQATILMLQEVFVIASFFADTCAAATLDQPEDKDHLEIKRQSAVKNLSNALAAAMENITTENLVVSDILETLKD